MYEKMTDRARKCLQLASKEAAEFNLEYVGTEMLLIGLLREGYGVAAHVLKNLGFTVEKVRDEVLKHTPRNDGPVVTMGRLPLTPRTTKVIEFANEEAKAIGNAYVGSEHLLLGLIREREGVAAQVLANCGCTLDDIHKQIVELVKQPSPSPADGDAVLAAANAVVAALNALPQQRRAAALALVAAKLVEMA